MRALPQADNTQKALNSSSNGSTNAPDASSMRLI